MSKAKYRNIPCYYDIDTGDIKGRSIFYDLLLDCMIWIDINLFEVEEFPIWVEIDKK